MSSPATIIVAPDTPAKRREYIEEVFGTFFVRNVDLKETMDALRVVGDLRSICADYQPEHDSRCATRRSGSSPPGRFVAAFDKARPEIVVDVEVLEVNRDEAPRVRHRSSRSPGSTGINGVVDANREGLTLQDLRSLSAADVSWRQHPGPVLPADQDRRPHADAGQSAHPHPGRRRGDGELRRGRAGAQTTITPITQGGIDIQPQTQFDYRKIGVNIGITPRTHANDEITLLLNIELSSLGPPGLRRAADVRQPQRDDDDPPA